MHRAKLKWRTSTNIFLWSITKNSSRLAASYSTYDMSFSSHIYIYTSAPKSCVCQINFNSSHGREKIIIGSTSSVGYSSIIIIFGNILISHQVASKCSCHIYRCQVFKSRLRLSQSLISQKITVKNN